MSGGPYLHTVPIGVYDVVSARCPDFVSDGAGLPYVTGTAVPGLFGGANIDSTHYACRSRHTAGSAATAVRLCFGGWAISTQTALADWGPFTLTMQVEKLDGTITDCTFGGSPSMSVAAGDEVICDEIPGFTLAAGEIFFVRVLVATTAGTTIYVCHGVDQSNPDGHGGDTFCFGQPLSSATFTNTFQATILPFAVVGKVAPGTPGAPALFGDSIEWGFSDGGSPTRDPIGWVRYALGVRRAWDGRPHLFFADGGMRAADITDVPQRAHQLNLVSRFCRAVVCQLGINDLLNQFQVGFAFDGPTVVQPHMRTAWSVLGAAGLPIIQATILPFYNAGATHDAVWDAGRIAHNDWLRTNPGGSGIRLLDLDPLVAGSIDATETTSPCYNANDQHPNSAGVEFIGGQAAAPLAALIPPVPAATMPNYAKPATPVLQPANPLALNARLILPITETTGNPAADVIGPTSPSVLFSPNTVPLTSTGSFGGTSCQVLAFSGTQSMLYAGRGTNLADGAHGLRRMLVAFNAGALTGPNQWALLDTTSGLWGNGLVVFPGAGAHLAIELSNGARETSPALAMPLLANHDYLFACDYLIDTTHTETLQFCLWDVTAGAFVSTTGTGWTIVSGIHSANRADGPGWLGYWSGGQSAPAGAAIGGLSFSSTYNAPTLTLTAATFAEQAGDGHALFDTTFMSAFIADPEAAVRAAATASHSFALLGVGH